MNSKPLVFRKDRERYKGQMTRFGRGDQGRPISFDRSEPMSRADANWTDTLSDRIAKRLERRLNT